MLGVHGIPAPGAPYRDGYFLLKIESARPAMFHAFGVLVLVEIAEMFQSTRSVAVESFRVLRHVVF